MNALGYAVNDDDMDEDDASDSSQEAFEDMGWRDISGYGSVEAEDEDLRDSEDEDLRDSEGEDESDTSISRHELTFREKCLE